MRPAVCLAFALAVAGGPAGAGAESSGESAQTLEFLAEEARVVTGSLQPRPASRVPATAHIVMADEIRASGARTLWDVMRLVPGVDVLTARAFNGQVGIRGLNGRSSRHVLVLLDGRTILNGYLDSVTWESVPVTLEEIDRIEVVEGPASALYGAGAVSGVINIITRTPEQVGGAQIGYAYGERNAQFGHVLAGHRKGSAGYKAAWGWRSGDQFEEAGALASESGRFSTFLIWDLPREGHVSLSGGLSDYRTQTSGRPDRSREEGRSGFVRADLARGRTEARAFWNAGRSALRPLPALSDPELNYDTFDIQITRGVALFEKNDLAAGASYRRNSARSPILEGGMVGQDLWALFLEDQWAFHERWEVVAGARADRHPFTGSRLSPRGSLLFFPAPAHTLRATAATAFRNPTLLENYIRATVSDPKTEITVLPNTGLKPEFMTMYEVGHRWTSGRFRTTAAGFVYRLADLIVGGPPRVVAAGPPKKVEIAVVNQGVLRGKGGEVGADVSVYPWLITFANYAYLDLVEEETPPDPVAPNAPRHKANVGARTHHGGLSLALWAHWVDKTFWRRAAGGAADLVEVPAYSLVNGYAGYRFGGKLEGLEVGVSAFNLGDLDHAEISPYESPAYPGRGGETLRRRVIGSVGYRF